MLRGNKCEKSCRFNRELCRKQVELTTFTAFYGPFNNSQFPNLPRQISRYLRGIITSSRTQFPFDIPLQITRFFSLHTREPTFSTLPTGLGTVPIRSRACHLSFHTQVVGFSSFPGHFRKCFIFFYKWIRTRVDLSDIISRQNRLQDFPRVSFPVYSPRVPFQNLSFSRIPGPFDTQTPILISLLFSFRTFWVVTALSYKLVLGGPVSHTSPPPRLRASVQK